MKRNLLLAAAAAVCLTWPATALADPPAGRGGGGDDQSQQGQDKAHGQGGQGGQAGHGGQKGPKAAAVTAAPPAQTTTVHAAPVGAGQFQGGSHQGGSSGHVVTGHQAQVHVQGGQGQVGVQGGQTGVAGPAFGGVGHGTFTGRTGRGAGPVVRSAPFVRQAARPPANLPVLSGWNRGVTGPDRDREGQQWRQAHGGWDNQAPWRSNRNWWRGNAAFRLFSGERIGFFFIPGFGYVSPPVEYRTHYWRAGDQLPNWFWRYQVRDYWNYGLPEPPDGCIWVWVDNDVALIDADDGYILDIVHNAW
jgi:Ni/Co efflux regulator RcnB